MRAARIVLVFLGIALALVGALSVAAGAYVLSLDNRYRDASGFFTTPVQTIGSNGFVLTAPDINDQLKGGWERWGLFHAGATVRVTGSSRLPGPVFVGIGPTARVSEYVAGITRDRITSIDLRAGSVEYDHVDGTAIPAPPEEQDFWAAKVAGTGSQTLEWELKEGDWAVVVMNADGSAHVAVDMKLGARFGVLKPLIIGFLVGGVAVLAIGLTVIGAGVSRSSRRRTARPAS